MEDGIYLDEDIPGSAPFAITIKAHALSITVPHFAPVADHGLVPIPFSSQPLQSRFLLPRRPATFKRTTGICGGPVHG